MASGGSGSADPAGPAAGVNLSGSWDVSVEFTVGPPKHHRFIQVSQDPSGVLSGMHTGLIGEAAVTGAVSGRGVTLHSEIPSPGGPLPFAFTGLLSEDGDTMSGRLECPAQSAKAPTGGSAEASGEASWSATRSAAAQEAGTGAALSSRASRL